VTGLGILVARVSVPCALPNFQSAAHPPSLSRPNYNGVLPHPAGRVNGQESPPSAGAITKATAHLGIYL